MHSRHSLALRLVPSLAIAIPLFTGCAMTSTDAAPSTITEPGAIHVQGMVHGGQQALGHALIQLYQVGVGTVPGAPGYAANAIPLIGSAVYSATDGTGSFSINGTYACSAGAQVYITATGGTIDGTTTNSNPNITLMAALGSCSSLLASASTGYINLNEVSTVAAAYALAQFSTTSAFGSALSAQPGTLTTAPADNIATSSGNMQGVINAMSTAAVLANSYSSSGGAPTGMSPGNNANGTASVEYWTVNTVANILAACVNSAATSLASAGDGTQCGTLYRYTTPSGKTAPRDTFQAALYMALYPGDANLLSGVNPGSNLTNLSSAAPPFLPYVAPDGTKNFINDWTIGISYSPVAPSTTTRLISVPYTLAADSVGNIWIYNINTAKPSFVMETDPTGNPVLAAPTPGSTACATTPCSAADYQITSYRKNGGTGSITFSLQVATNTTGLAIDPSNNVWVVDRTGKYVFYVGGSGSGSAENGGYLNGAAEAYQITTGSPVVPAVDGNGIPWFTVNATNDVSCTSQTVTGGSFELASIQGASTSTGKGGTLTYGGPGGVSGSSIAIDAGNPLCTASTSTMACNTTIYDKLSGSSSAISGSPFVWAQYNTGQGGALPNASKASTVGHYLTGNGSFTVPGCESALGQIGDADTTVAPTTIVPDINPSGSDAIDFMAQGRGISFGSNNTMWFANNNFADANSTVSNSISSYVPTYGSAFTPAGFESASPAFTSFSGGGLGSTFGVQALAIDGANSPWAFGLATATGATQTQVVHLSATGAPLSTSTGYLGTTYYNPNTSTAQHRTSGLASYGGAIDGSGNVWAPDSDATSTSIYVLVGAATPVVAPLSLGVRNGTLGTMP